MAKFYNFNSEVQLYLVKEYLKKISDCGTKKIMYQCMDNNAHWFCVDGFAAFRLTCKPDELAFNPIVCRETTLFTSFANNETSAHPLVEKEKKFYKEGKKEGVAVLFTLTDNPETEIYIKEKFLKLYGYGKQTLHFSGTSKSNAVYVYNECNELLGAVTPFVPKERM